MEYVVVFVGGALAAVSALLIGYFRYVSLLRAEQRQVRTWDAQLKAESADLGQKARTLAEKQSQLNEGIAAFEARRVKYDDLVRENSGLKQDCFNLSVQLKKMELDHAALAKRQDEIDHKANELAGRYLKESVSWIGAKLNANNFSSCKQRLLNVIGACRSIGFGVPADQERELVQDLQKCFEQAVRDEYAREEQARIKVQIREEEKLARERAKEDEELERETQEADRIVQDAAREVELMRAAMEKALKETQDEHNVEVEFYKMKLQEAEEKRTLAEAKRAEAEANRQRAISLAQLTKTGCVYVISNIGSFGEGVFKVGMTRRLNREERVEELSNASVPFPFDVQMMIRCDDAPSLENAIHRELRKQRVNKANPRKEFFRVDLDSLRRLAESLNGKVIEFNPVPEAEQYRETIGMSDNDAEEYEKAYGSVMADTDASNGDEE